MSTPIVTDEMVEAGAKADYEAALATNPEPGDIHWDDPENDMRPLCRHSMRAALEAALAVAPATSELDTVLGEIESMGFDWLIDSITDEDGNRVYRSCGFLSGWKSGDLEFTRFLKLTAAIALRDAIKAQVQP